MKLHLQYAEQQISRSNLTKYCACHEKWHYKILKKISKNRWNVIANAGLIRAWSDHENVNRNPPRNRGYFSTSPRAFSIVKYNVSRPMLHSNIHQVLRLPQKVTKERHQVLRLPRKVTLERHQVLHLPRKVTLELHQVLHLPRKLTLELHYSTLLDSTLLYLTLLDFTHMNPHLQYAEQQVSRSNLTKYCARHAERLTYLIIITYETSFTMPGATGVLRLPRKMTLQDFKENLQKQVKRHFQCGADPSMIRPWKRKTATRLATKVTFRPHHEHVLLQNTTFRA